MRGDMNRLEELVDRAARQLADAATERQRLTDEIEALRAGQVSTDDGSSARWKERRQEALALIDRALS